MSTVREQIKLQAREIATKKEQFEREIVCAAEALDRARPKFIRDEPSEQRVEAYLSRDGNLELYCDGELTEATTDKFVNWILNNFVRKDKA